MSTVVFALLFLLGVIALAIAIWGFAGRPALCQPGESHVACFRAWLAALGPVTALGAAILAGSIAFQQLGVAKKALLTVQRATVFADAVATSKVSDATTGATLGWSFTIVWRNSGPTPTKALEIKTGARAFNGPMPEDFAFPLPKDAIAAFIGPQTNTTTPPIAYPLEALAPVKGGAQQLFIWGSAEYNDVFDGTSRHRTEFCYQIIADGDLATDKATFTFSLCDRHNTFFDLP